jgi:hypothetical protein
LVRWLPRLLLLRLLSQPILVLAVAANKEESDTGDEEKRKSDTYGYSSYGSRGE